MLKRGLEIKLIRTRKHNKMLMKLLCKALKDVLEEDGGQDKDDLSN
jgi:hypothetical protein